ncbi:hypothetical protein [Metabacillus litoralis]|uniref:hypothetical protein n=1 Tax=Metabacillus litoralis TaxID=152268 RepID=UPI000EF589A2|nr:hypothetical protein [Metabacillus litoralis]
MDNLDSLVLELYSRIKNLENKVEMLEVRLSDNQRSFENEEVNEINNEEQPKRITRSVARKQAIDKIENLNPSINVKIAKRSDSGDLIIQKNKITLDAKFYYSKSHIKEHVSSWHTVKEEDIFNDDIDIHIFSVSYEGEFHTFLFTAQELQNFVKNKESGSAELYHFYFHKHGDQTTEVRDGEKDVNKFYERWSVVADLL